MESEWIEVIQIAEAGWVDDPNKIQFTFNIRKNFCLKDKKYFLLS